MPFRTILSVVGADHGDGDLALAAGLCEEAEAHLSVLALAAVDPPPVDDYTGLSAAVWTEQRQAHAARLAERASAAAAFLAGRALSGDVNSERVESGRVDEAVGRRARYADLTVVGPELLADVTLRERALDGAMFLSGKPLLLVPEGSRPSLRPKRVLVAWDGRVEASRAVREAVELLAAADEVRLALVDPVPNEGGHGAEPGADAAAFLSRHGAAVAVDRLPSMGRPVADVLRRHADDTGAELLVMGAYGHSRLRERIFGGVTRSMVERPPLPVLMAR